MLRTIQASKLEDVLRWIQVFWEAIKSCALWIMHLPGAALSAIVDLVSLLMRMIGRVFLATTLLLLKCAMYIVGFIILFNLACHLLPPLVKLLRHLVQRHQNHRRWKREEAEHQERMRLVEEAHERAEQTRRQQLEAEQLTRDRNLRDAEQRRKVQEEQRQEWRTRCDSLLEDKQKMTRFPDIPSGFGSCSSCPENPILRACQHSVRRLFEASDQDLKKCLEQERLKWHPDCFSRCPEGSRSQIQAKAEELFKIIDQLLDHCKKENTQE